MSNRFVLPHLFKVQMARINWDEEIRRLNYIGPKLRTGTEEGLLHFRWLLHPAVGLPKQPFTLWINRDPGGNLDNQKLVNLPNWKPLEVIGLPVDESWKTTGYNLGSQGPVNNPLPPIDAALRRLKLGAPRIGWTRLTQNGLSLPDWDPSNLEEYLKDILGGRLLEGIQSMLLHEPNVLKHCKYVEVEEDIHNPGRLYPNLFPSKRNIVQREHYTARNEWHPLNTLLLGAGTDSLASLALGFGTALSHAPEEPDILYMVTVPHELHIEPFGVIPIELADVVSVRQQLPPPESLTGLSTNLKSYDRPQVLDGPALETVGVSWDRVVTPDCQFTDNKHGYPTSYVIGRFATDSKPEEILLTSRPHNVGGCLPYVASKPVKSGPVLFNDHIVRSTISGTHEIASVQGLHCTYGVAAQDIFGRFGPWSTVTYQGRDEESQIPSILSLSVDLSGMVTVEFAWDWSDRSPEFVELVGAYGDETNNPSFYTRLQFTSKDQPDLLGGGEVIPLTPDRKKAVGWGGAQDINHLEPEVRLYRLCIQIPISLKGKPSRIFQVMARGQCHIHQVAMSGWNVSSYTSPVQYCINDPRPPLQPKPIGPQWASLSGTDGISRMKLTWPNNDPSRVEGYVLYEATETTLLSALGDLPGPDTSESFPKRLHRLQELLEKCLSENVQKVRNAFRRLQKELIPPGIGGNTVYEVTLPRGSRVMQFFVVTAMSHNKVESDWPVNKDFYMAIAAPRLAVPTAPTLAADPKPEETSPVVNLHLTLGSGVAVNQVEFYRISGEKMPDSVDSMGPPLVTLNVSYPEVNFVDNSVTPSWQPQWYRAVSWSARDDYNGLIETRSSASAPVSIMLPPQTPPEVVELRVNEPGSTITETIVSWSSHAPLNKTRLGSHTTALEVYADETGNQRIEHRASSLDELNKINDSKNLPNNKEIFYLVSNDNYRFYARLLRPNRSKPFKVKVKVIDPLGKIGCISIVIPPLPFY
ncbi:hypothetical protein ACFU6E_13405 [Bacillus cereus]|uniref:hypothetical protein n=1 Tax=Bacillus cereus TaxID=1396 RepID=UPI0036712E4A